jgi:HK97 family phage portal protein
VPIEPTLVTPKQLYTTLPNGARVAGREVFDIRDPQTGRTSTFTQDEIFHLRGAGGKGILEYARTSLGTALATETYAGGVFGSGNLNGGVIETPGTLDPEASRRMALTFTTKPGEWHLPKVLEQGSTWKPNTMTPEDAQMLLSRKYSVDDIARWLGVPRQMLENSDPSFGNAEQFWQAFLTVSMGGWLSLFEFAVNSQLVLVPAKYFAQFTRQALMRGNFRDRIEALVLAAGGPIFTTDEARAIEDRNTLGGKAAELRENQNVTGKPAAPPAADPTPPTKTPPADDPKGRNRSGAIVLASAERLLRKEITAVQKAAVKHAADAEAFTTWVTAFYAAHTILVMQTLQMAQADAESYCGSQRQQILTCWLAALELWQSDHYASGLAALALEDEEAA